MKIGAHESISGGIEKALERGQEVGCEVVQVFTKSNRRWAARELTQQDREALQETREALDVEPVMVHMAYLINLASPEEDQQKKSFDAFVTELQRAEFLDIPTICFHPGSHKGDGVENAIERVGNTVRRGIRESGTDTVRVLVEGMAGQGTSVGHRFEHLRDILDFAGMPDRTGICLDTAHLHAAGYSLAEEDYEDTVEEFDQIVGLDQVYGWHFNDTDEELGSQVDRHQHIGEGNLGTEPFRCILQDSRMEGLPAVIETPKEDDWDQKNISRLKELRGA